MRRSRVVGQLPLFAVEEVYASAATSDDCITGEGVDEATAERKSGRPVGEEGASAGLAPGLEGVLVTVSEKCICPSCGLAGKPSPALDVCASCKSAALEPVQGTLAALELQVDDFREQLGEAGYLGLVGNDSAAPYVALADAEETRRARDVIAAHEHVFDDEGDVALEEGAAVMAEHERARDQLYEHGWTDGDRSLPEAIDDVLAFTAEAERAYRLLFDHDLLPTEMNLPGAVQGLIAETAQVRAELGEGGYSCWAQAPAEVVREFIAHAEEADALEQRYLRERRRSQRMADIAPRALASAHAVGHDGAIDACPHCASDWAQLPARV